jgi:hypothetical protein
LWAVEKGGGAAVLTGCCNWYSRGDDLFKEVNAQQKELL